MCCSCFHASCLASTSQPADGRRKEEVGKHQHYLYGRGERQGGRKHQWVAHTHTHIANSGHQCCRGSALDSTGLLKHAFLRSRNIVVYIQPHVGLFALKCCGFAMVLNRFRLSPCACCIVTRLCSCRVSSLWLSSACRYFVKWPLAASGLLLPPFCWHAFLMEAPLLSRSFQPRWMN